MDFLSLKWAISSAHRSLQWCLGGCSASNGRLEWWPVFAYCAQPNELTLEKYLRRLGKPTTYPCGWVCSEYPSTKLQQHDGRLRPPPCLILNKRGLWASLPVDQPQPINEFVPWNPLAKHLAHRDLISQPQRPVGHPPDTDHSKDGHWMTKPINASSCAHQFHWDVWPKLSCGPRNRHDQYQRLIEWLWKWWI